MNLELLIKTLNNYLINNKKEYYFTKSNIKIYQSISVGIQRGTHPYFNKLNQQIKNHISPLDFFKNSFPYYENINDLSVVSLIFHYDPQIVEDNSKSYFHPVESWYDSIQKTKKIFENFSIFIKNFFKENKIVFPFMSRLYSVLKESKIRTANWSERHIAFACGLGSFGLHGALITEKGCTHRITSFIIDKVFEEYAEILDNPYSNCLYYTKKICRKCIDRCPVCAIIPGKHIIEKCLDYEDITNKEYSKKTYGIETAACGLCMSGVPCSLKNPVV